MITILIEINCIRWETECLGEVYHIDTSWILSSCLFDLKLCLHIIHSIILDMERCTELPIWMKSENNKLRMNYLNVYLEKFLWMGVISLDNFSEIDCLEMLLGKYSPIENCWGLNGYFQDFSSPWIISVDFSFSSRVFDDNLLCTKDLYNVYYSNKNIP